MDIDYRKIIESRYNRQNWQLLLRDIFKSRVEFWATPYEISANSPMAKQALWLGTITLSDDETIAIYEVELSDSVDIERNRRGIRDMLLTEWRNRDAGAFMFCYRKTESVLRFSYVSESWNFAEDGTYQKESTDTKRYTYLLGEGHRSRTAIQQFEELKKSDLNLKALTKAFSVEAVSKMFFDEYKKNYEDIIQFITGKRMVKVANKWEEQVKNEPCEAIMQEFAHFPNPEKSVRDYVKKLMGRLVFLQFLQKKGWLGVKNGEWGSGDAEFLQTLYKNCDDKDHFVDNVLEELFNELNTEHDIEASHFKVPYLNGGLFEREAADETEFPLPAKYMQQMLDFFASYNFTIDENDPDDAEVGVDPEMLGRIFENLLEDNKDKGAFYTPKEIVSYMCRESLIAYLQTDIEDEATKEAIRQFVTTHDINALGQNQMFRQQVDDALKNVKICDPAIGSGAFPMGLLKELFQCRTALEGIEQSKAAEIKKHIIQNNIYGVDIERGAVDIARLRFWLSLIVDEETPQALPNLDFKIMQGNSLLEQYKGVDLSNITELKQDKVGAYQTTMFDDMLDVLRLDLRKELDEYYNCTDHRRKAILKQDIINNVKQQLREQSINVDFGNLDLSGNNQFMLWHTWFYDVFSQGGFDIVIGNPPYLEARSPKFSNELKSNLQNEISKRRGKDAGSFPRGADLLIFFYELSLRILNDRGYNVFITENSWLSTDYGKAFQQFLIRNCFVYAIIDSEYKYFDTADINTVITIFKNKNESMTSSFIKFFHCNGSLEKYPCNTSLNNDVVNITLKMFPTSDTLLQTYKWSVIIKAAPRLLRIMESLYSYENKKLSSKISIGQGLNLTKNDIFDTQVPNSFPYYTSDIGPTYSWEKSNHYVHIADISNGRKIPQLIMPRGIGTHFCCINNCSGYSSSYVEIYGNLSKEDILNIWLFCNSSLFWLLREITGRTNLGGGMLKAEATDLRSIPICYDFKSTREIEEIYKSVKNVTLSTNIAQTLNDICHNKIDSIVFSFLGLEDEAFYIKETLIECINGRMKKSKT